MTARNLSSAHMIRPPRKFGCGFGTPRARLTGIGAVEKALNAKGETLLFAMNAGMYRANRAPVGLFIEDGRVITPANRRDGPGNFHLKPNGVFWLFRSVDPAVPEPWPPFAAVSTTEEHAGAHAVAYATQSGPMLVIDGDIHPRFIKTSDSLKRRNGVGVTEEGDVVFVIADTPVRFYDFAVFFRDELNAPNALYLDGTISRLYAPALGRNDPGLPMGPIVGVVGRK